jgi:MFS family permease
LVAAAAVIAVFPRVSTPWFIPLYGAFGFFFMASYPMVEAALMESVPDAVRGRVVGLFITVAGIVGNFAHGWVGAWVKRLGPEAERPSSYFSMYLILGVMVLAALPGLACLKALRQGESPVSPDPTAAS